MAREYAKEFYASTEWKRCREAYSKSKAYICEKCGSVASEVHHIKHINPDNINDPEITLNFDNLMCLCHSCHMKQHRKYKDSDRYIIDAEGHVIPI